MSFVQLFLTHISSLEFVLGFCHVIAKEGNPLIDSIENVEQYLWLELL